MSKFVLLMWSEYHNLNPDAGAYVYDSTEEAASASDSYLDEVIEVTDDNSASELCQAFRNLARADWTPNQTSDDRDHYYDVRAEAKRILAKYGA